LNHRPTNTLCDHARLGRPECDGYTAAMRSDRCRQRVSETTAVVDQSRPRRSGAKERLPTVGGKLTEEAFRLSQSGKNISSSGPTDWKSRLFSIVALLPAPRRRPEHHSHSNDLEIRRQGRSRNSTAMPSRFSASMLSRSTSFRSTSL
jgi:hypothetical protein